LPLSKLVTNQALIEAKKKDVLKLLFYSSKGMEYYEMIMLGVNQYIEELKEISRRVNENILTLEVKSSRIFSSSFATLSLKESP
jgi:hypothetical protein